MCGITGAFSAAPDARIGEQCLRAARAIAHRGPDGEGFCALDAEGARLVTPAELQSPLDAVLAHRRLSIVDLEGGAQPMSNEDGSVWVSFNGEIYNQAALREELEARGHVFATRADTEVLVHGWEEWGEGLFGRLNGIFAFAICDARRRGVALVRDPAGVKPLYLGTAGDVTWWASELQAAVGTGWAGDEISPDGLKLYLTFRFVPSPRTMLEGAWKLPPGHFVWVDREAAGRAPRFRPYATSIRSAAEPRSRAEWREAMLAGLEDAVSRQLMSDVPVGSLLSGGVDSSVVTAMMAAHLPYVPEAFGIGFPADGDANEVLAAQHAADRLGVPLRGTEVAEQDYVDGWPRALEELGEPIANTGALLVRLLCADVGRTHKVVLSGQGADEPLGGYPRHMIERLHRFGRLAPRLGRAVVRRAFGDENAVRLGRALAAPDLAARFVETFAVLPPERVDAIVEGGELSASQLARDAVARWLADDAPADPLNELLRVDARMSLADDLLVIGDHFSMRSSVELRVPFLDLELLEMLERMPSRYKISLLGERKWLYRRGARDRLPGELGTELCAPERLRRKRGFSTPRAWFEDPEGLEARRDDWSAGLRRLPVHRSALDADARPGPRERALLYTLSMWSDVHAAGAVSAGSATS